MTKSEHSKIHKQGERHHMYGLYGKDNPNYGSHRSEESRNNIRIAALNRKPDSEETRRKKSLCKLGKHKVYDENGKFHYE